MSLVSAYESWMKYLHKKQTALIAFLIILLSSSWMTVPVFGQLAPTQPNSSTIPDTTHKFPQIDFHGNLVPDSTKNSDTTRKFPSYEFIGKPLTDTTKKADTTKLPLKPSTGAVIPDSTHKADTTATDSTKKSDLDTVVTYNADKIEMYAKNKLTVLTGRAVVNYKTMTLSAYRIKVDWDHNMVFAEGRPDTLYTDTSGTKIDTIVIVDNPLFFDHASPADSLHGYRMEMNLKTQKGRVFTGSSATDQGKYRGDTLKRVEPQVMYVRSGDFTTCDEIPPHYHFHSEYMKLVYHDKLIARPVELYFGDVPVAIAPFAIFSLKPGRHSGLIFPAYGESSGSGRYFKHLGYYLAPSDYWDSQVTMDYYERLGTVWNMWNNYAERYYLNGRVYGSYLHETGITSWNTHWEHSQDFDPTFHLNSNVYYTSDQRLQQTNLVNLNDILQQEASSYINLTKNWVDSRASMSAGLTATQNIRNRNYSLTMPSLSFNWGTGPLFSKGKSDIVNGFGGPPKKDSTATINPDGTVTTPEPAWWETATYDYHMTLYNTETGSRDTTLIDSNAVPYWYRLKSQYIRHTSNLNAPQKILSYFTVNPSLSITDDWVPEITQNYFVNDSTIASKKTRGFYNRTTFTTGIGVGTKIYGFLDPKGLFGLNGIRHVITPNIGINYQPNFADRRFGIMQRLVDPRTGREYVSDPWASTAVGVTPSTRVFGMSMGANNVFQARYEKGDETKKIDLFTWNVSTGYTFSADSFKWSNVGMTWQASPFTGGSGILSNMGVDISSTYSFYKFVYSDPVNKVGRTANQFYWDNDNHTAPLRFLSGSANFSFSWKRPKAEAEKPDTTKKADSLGGTDLPQLPQPMGVNTGTLTGTSADYRPVVAGAPLDWTASSSLYLTYDEQNPKLPVKQAQLTFSSVTLNVTPTFALSSGLVLNLINHQVSASQITATKDLHCWEILFTWNPRGVGQGFYLNIHVKSPDLQDLKLEKDQRKGAFY